MGKFPQMLKLGHRLIVMSSSRKHPENKRKAADVKEIASVSLRKQQKHPCGSQELIGSQAWKAEPESLLVLQLLYLRKQRFVSFLAK